MRNQIALKINEHSSTTLTNQQLNQVLHFPINYNELDCFYRTVSSSREFNCDSNCYLSKKKKYKASCPFRLIPREEALGTQRRGDQVGCVCSFQFFQVCPHASIRPYVNNSSCKGGCFYRHAIRFISNVAPTADTVISSYTFPERFACLQGRPHIPSI